MLAHVLRAELRARPPGAAVLDLFTGSGVLAVVAGLAGAGQVTAVDVSRRAVVTAWLNGRLNGVRVRARRGDLLAPVSAERFDVVTANPPYLPSASEELPDSGLARATEAGPDGRAFLDRLLPEAPAHLRPGGVLLVVHSSLNGEDATLDGMRAAGLEPEVRLREPGPLGPRLAARAHDLEARGLLTPGERHEEILVIAGRRAG
jgi:release factor glutamine methyltransferase